MQITRTPSRQRGQGMTEYIIIVALIAVAAIGVYSYFGQAVKSQTSAMTQELSGKDGTAEKNKAQAAATGAATATATKSNLGNYTNQNK